ncbi:hypothetical protein CYV19_01380 [Natronobacterium gregoryi SP2]|uniref:Cytochrome C biogenesis protein transmembrane domain-containing protein n=1 Tax=Natronobacterium gregoryi (strain ATCC 43098 / DSM 3393 / CCM 3738 / CIP 104747 / IAM 13177 / JCM 8860 / NBRC 102187 / NCIMB 2189 / SP2) TaxID=797304 RepID=L9XR12_NATGS|nr:hypothetical protein C490_15097 [Natronobacterium gregoryi SP2]PLK22071.1 hypothetical protein CYV19_01380 [Natronobacterium gregoryi SP2]
MLLVGAFVFGSGPISFPILGEIEPEEHSLFVSTLLIGLVDGFNPCSLWVLTVLLGITVHAGRKKSIVVGLTFLSITAVIYGLFIAGVLSIFAYVSHLDAIRAVVAFFAIVFGIVSIKDFFALGRWVSFSIGDSHKPKIYDRIRTAVYADGMLSTIGATAIMAAGIALVELPCTSGFPLVWSNLVAATEPSTAIYSSLLSLYLLAYLSIELVVFGVAVVTLEKIRYGEPKGRVLKLLAGTVMIALGGALLVEPTILESVQATVLLFAGAAGITAAVSVVFYRTGRL